MLFVFVTSTSYFIVWPSFTKSPSFKLFPPDIAATFICKLEVSFSLFITAIFSFCIFVLSDTNPTAVEVAFCWFLYLYSASVFTYPNILVSCSVMSKLYSSSIFSPGFNFVSCSFILK